MKTICKEFDLRIKNEEVTGTCHWIKDKKWEERKYLEEHLNEKPVHETERHVPTIEPIWYETANRNKDAVSLNVLYKSTKPDIQYNRIRKEYRGGHVWLDPEIMALKEPEYAEKQVDISSYFEQAKAANSCNNKRNSSTAVKEEEAVDSEYQEDDD